MTTAPAAGVHCQAAMGDLLEALPNGLLIDFDDHLQVVAATGGGLAVFAHDPSQLIGRPPAAFLPATLVAAIEPYLRAAVEGTAGSFEVPVPGAGRLLLVAAPAGSEEDGTGLGPVVQLYGAWLNATADEEWAPRARRTRG
ncbi:MAG: PAS domain-containing protein [Caldilineaceae bacterium]